MNVKVLYWKDDLAATNIARNLKEIGLGNLLIESKKSLLFTTQKELETFVQDMGKIDFFIIASTHRSEANRKTLSLHPTGNFGKAELGGNSNELSITMPSALKTGLVYLNKNKPDDFEAANEATHHGPTDWKKPLVFIEIGSTEKEWTREDCGKVVAGAIKEICETHKKEKPNFENYIGFGGIHYCPSFSKIAIENEKIAFGHVAPKYAVEFLNEKIVGEMLEKSAAKKALIDWKGLKSEGRNKVIRILENLKVELHKTSEF